jgi:hypothetical protein
VEVDPAISGRWGPSLVVRPRGAVADALARLTDEALTIAGDGHWATGSEGGAHVTIRAFEHWGTPASEVQIEAVRRAFIEPITLSFAGTALTSTVVMATAADVVGGDALRARLAAELGDAGWLEDRFIPGGRDRWYATLVRFATPDIDVDGLEAWVGEHHEIGTATFDTADVCEWRFDGRRMQPVVVATVRC